jgi:Leucine-rich repeat (LRR) protein
MGQHQSKTALSLRIERAVKLGVLTLNGLDLKEIPDRLDIVSSVLKELDLSNNRFYFHTNRSKLKSSEYEKFSGSWTSLKGLACSSNTIKDFAWVALIVSLERLNLHSNSIAFIPSSVITPSSYSQISSLENLKVLDLSKNEITIIASEICQLSKLVTLNLSHNKITELPESFGRYNSTLIFRLEKLEVLEISNNILASLPEDLSGLSSIKSFHMANNLLLSIPVSLLATGITSIDFDHNPLQLDTFREVPGYETYCARRKGRILKAE